MGNQASASTGTIRPNTRPPNHQYRNNREQFLNTTADALDTAKDFNKQRSQTQKDWEKIVVENKKHQCKQNPSADGCQPTWNQGYKSNK